MNKSNFNWWESAPKRNTLLAIAKRESAAFIYDQDTLRASIAQVLSVEAVDRWAYAMKANWHPQVLRAVEQAGLSLECVSPGEIRQVFACLPRIVPKRILFTPNFAARAEYEFGFNWHVNVTLDNLYPLKIWPRIFAGREIILRVDLGVGRGHHDHVKTGGELSKFGVPLSEIEEVLTLAKANDTKIIGLHAHAGSGIFDVDNWVENCQALANLAERFAEVRILNLGGGIGVPDRPQVQPFDFEALDQHLGSLKARLPERQLWLEPGRFIVASCGVLVAQVTQLKGKGDTQYVGLATGMNSLIRPALYGAHHEIVNLTRLEEPASRLVTIVGPICETGDFLGSARLLPECREGDVLLIATCGAYGRAMSSHYNLRDPAPEFFIG